MSADNPNDNKKTGYVYILTNPSFRDDWVKIGKSARPVDLRSKELDNTAVPLPFEIYATLKSVKYNEVEKLVHKTIDRLTDLRIRQNREFFNIHPAEALAILKDIALTIDDAEIEVFYKENHVLTEKDEHENEVSHQKRTSARPPFRFSMIGLHPGDIVRFDELGINVKIASDNQIEYQGRLWKLSPFVSTFMPDSKKNTSGAYQGPKFFSYNGETLEQLRLKKERTLK